MQVRKIKVGYLQTNCYILEENGKCIVIDPGDQFYSIEEQIGENKLIGILVTHGHSDHIGALKRIVDTYKVPVYAKNNLKEQKYSLGDFNFEVIYTPGHTDDSITFLFNDYGFMFTGDFLFNRSIGRTDMPTGSMEEMKNSISKIKEYSDRLRVYPGHGDATNLGEEKLENPFFVND